MQQIYERMRDCWPVFSWIQLLRESVKGKRVLAKIADIEHGLGMWEVQAREVRIEPGLRRTKVWNSRRCAYTCACLARVSSKLQPSRVNKSLP